MAFSSKLGNGSFRHFQLKGDGKLCPGFEALVCFLWHLQGQGFWGCWKCAWRPRYKFPVCETLLATFNGSCEIHKCMCFSEASKPKHSCTISLFCRKLCPMAWGTSGSLWHNRSTSDTQRPHWLFLHTRYHHFLQAEASLTHNQWTIYAWHSDVVRT